MNRNDGANDLGKKKQIFDPYKETLMKPAAYYALMAILFTNLAIAASAHGVVFQYTAVTQAPVAVKQGAVIAENLTWMCRGNRCTISGPWPSPTVVACQALAREVGKLSSYGHPKAQLNAAQLVQCNTSAPALPPSAQKPLNTRVSPVTPESGISGHKANTSTPVSPPFEKPAPGQGTAAPTVATPDIGKRVRKSGFGGDGEVPLPIAVPGKSRVPIDGHLPISDPGRRIKPSSPLPAREISGARQARASLLDKIRVEGRVGLVDLRGHPASARLDWLLAKPASDSVIIIEGLDAGGNCPAAGTAESEAYRQLRFDRRVLNFQIFSPRGSNDYQFAARSEYQPESERITDVYIQACGKRGNTLNGITTNVVRVRLSNHIVVIPVMHWGIEWSLDTDANVFCGVDTSAIPPPIGTPVGFRSVVTRGPDPFPCIRDSLYQYQPSAAFDMSHLSRDTQIARATLRFIQLDTEGWRETECNHAVQAVGLATTPVRPGSRHVDAVSHRADAARDVPPRRSWVAMDVTDWVRSWQQGRAAELTFLGRPAQRNGAACKTDLGDVQINVEIE